MRRTLCLAGLLVFAGCATESGGSAETSVQPVMDQSVPFVARQACLQEVGRTTNNPSVTILEMVRSEASNQVKVGVGKTAAPWQCLVSDAGEVAEVRSLTDEGAL
jgi:hypothetical protein